MNLSAHVLGKHAVDAIAETARGALLVIGSDTFRRGDLAGIGCFNFHAAANLSRAIAELGAKHTRDLFENYPPAALVLPRVGAISLAVLGAAFEKKGIGGDQPLEAWVTRHRAPDTTREFVTFETLKAREAAREPGERKARAARRTRTATRRHAAHRIRVGRFVKRREAQ